MTLRFRDLRIAVRLGLLGALMLAATIIVAVGGWQGLVKTHALEVSSMQRMAAFATAVDTARVAQVGFKKQVQEWKDLLLRGGDATSFQKYRSAFVDDSNKVYADLAALKNQMTKLGISTAGVETAIATHADLQTKYLAALAHYDAKQPATAHEVDGLVKGIDRAPTAAIDDLVATMKKSSAADSALVDNEREKTARDALRLLVSASVCALLVGALATWLLTQSITVPIGRAVKLAQAVAQGNLSGQIETPSRDETGMLLAALGEMSEQLQRVVGAIRKEASEISVSTEQIAKGNLDLSARTSEQAAALEETAATMQQFTESVSSNASGAREASALAESASETARQSSGAMSEAVAAMAQIRGVSSRIAEITEMMDRLATQTHILAINAAVEAAHAGEAGRGFAIVAGEVQSLARNSRAASGQIRSLINESVAIVASGTQRIGDAESMVGQLLRGVDEVARTVGAIARGSVEQATGIQQVNRAVSQMDQVTQNNAALVEEAAAAADAVQQRALSLVHSVEFFKLVPDAEAA
ncbi:methyl-accepting chemotaxis protein [Rhodanobacter umsongensis]|uniref:Methyl-accepting chemotaxis protein n=1 Tax=Rhodanobacter umsongensis TaxID=633153 RepID=A0ABW0JIN1_9GAMM